MHDFNLATALHDCFIRPFSNKGLIGLYLSTVIGLIGRFLIVIYVAYDLSDHGLIALLSFYISMPLMANLIFMPVGFYLYSKLSGRSFVLMGLIYQTLFFAAIIFLYPHDYPVLKALAASLMAIPFWVMYHASILFYSTHANRGNEISLAHIGMAIGTILGSVAAGLCLSLNLADGFVLSIGGALTLMATVLLFFSAYKSGILRIAADKQSQTFTRDVCNILSSKRLQAKATSLEMVYETAVATLWPIWLKVVGASGLAVGLLSALNVLIKLIISPFVGHFINRGDGQEAYNGPLLKIAGWVPWLFFAHPLTALWSSTFFAAGSHMFRVGLEARWYKDRAYAPMAAREILLGFGRMAGAVIFIPILLYAPSYFVPLGIAFTSLVFLSGIQLRQFSMAAAE